MYPPIFATVNVAAVQTVLKSGTGPLRFWMFGQAPQNPVMPYAVWQFVGGLPENYLSDLPDVDSMTVQVDVYASQSQGPSVARNVSERLRDAIEPNAHIVSWRGESRDTTTNEWRVSFDCDWWVGRQPPS